MKPNTLGDVIGAYKSLTTVAWLRHIKATGMECSGIAAIAQALQVAALETAPPPLAGKMAARCPNCSLLPLCLPDEVRLLRSKKGK